MELTDLVHEFSRASVKRAASYVLSGEVLITEHGPDLVKAIVRGGAPYDIELRIERRRLSLSCDCPSFFSYGPCKHLWATLMVAERQGILRQMSPFDHVDAHGDDRDDGDYWEDEVVALMRQQASELAAVLEPELSRIQKAFVEARGAGQDKHVFVYRLLCGGTVEEKVAALQESKRNLAESIITTSESLIRDLDRQTLEMLLS